ncbi:VOC family protein [Nocardioides sp.]|uniref:VOC family protein n=1 Tax=Nocardioides sp. TaxID=35761 RepID=UPI0039E3CAFE
MSHPPGVVRRKGMNTLHSIIHPVTDIEAAKAIHSALLGVEPHTDTPYYVGYNVGGVEIALNPQGHAQGLTGPVAQFGVEDLGAAVEAVVAAGATLVSAPTEVGGGTTIATVADKDGNVTGLIARS